jgi:hypothetical protein
MVVKMIQTLREKISQKILIAAIVIIFLLFLVSLVGFFFYSRPPLEGVQINYARKELFFSLAARLAIATSLMLIGLAVLSLFLKKMKAAILGLLITAITCSAVFITLWITFGGYSEVDKVALDNHVYRLIQLFDVDGFYNYALCPCDSRGEMCTCYHVYSSWNPGNEVRLSARQSPTSTISITIDNEIVCSYEAPLSFQGEHIDYGGYSYSECRSE